MVAGHEYRSHAPRGNAVRDAPRHTVTQATRACGSERRIKDVRTQKLISITSSGTISLPAVLATISSTLTPGARSRRMNAPFSISR
ncbi:hypothetical protein PssB301D_01813 [Pseudomonas syringae pv. syringae str. B301D-R]|nr:hypothetical protein PsyrB_16720 [Pseudomonas syringae pv. syringae B301D]EXL31808.1 hypothetical protein PssB301D_01813 [Pseudomonas syringae pv. syringae str. B301D-R]SOQ00824.1 putative membrane protein [Pseudomonas syringae pv. syringae]